MSWSLETIYLFSCDHPDCGNTWDCIAFALRVGDARAGAARDGWVSGAPPEPPYDYCPDHRQQAVSPDLT